MTDTRTIQRAAEETGLTADTLRYYERIGILPGIGRSQSGHRRFTDDDMGWIKLVQCLRATGMPLEDLHRYAELVQEGEHTAAERLSLLEAHKLPHRGRARGAHGGARPGRHEDRRVHEARREGLRPRAARPPARAAAGPPEDRTPALRRRSRRAADQFDAIARATVRDRYRLPRARWARRSAPPVLPTVRSRSLHQRPDRAPQSCGMGPVRSVFPSCHSIPSGSRPSCSAPSPTRATPSPPRSSARRSRSSSSAATCSPAPRPAPARPPPSSSRSSRSSTRRAVGPARPEPARRSRAAGPRPATARPPVRVLVVVPTRELAIQVEESVRTYGKHRPIRSTTIYGGVGFEPQAAKLRAGPEIVVATPGRLLDHVEPADHRPLAGRDPRPRRGRPPPRHGLHPRHPQDHRPAAAAAGRTCCSRRRSRTTSAASPRACSTSPPASRSRRATRPPSSSSRS